MTSELELNRDRVIAEIFREIIEEEDIREVRAKRAQIREMGKRICLKHFPNAHNNLINEFSNFSFHLAHGFVCFKTLNKEIECPYKQNKLM